MLDLTLKISEPNGVYKGLIGEKNYQAKLDELRHAYGNTCQCCGWNTNEQINDSPEEVQEKRNHFVIHIDELDEQNILNSKVNLICKSCYLINHIDVAVNHNLATIVNSTFSQQDLIKISWSDVSKKQIIGNNRDKAVKDRVIIPLKDQEKWLNKIKEGYLSDKMKVIFNDNFLKR